MDKLYAKLSEQQATLLNHKSEAIKSLDEGVAFSHGGADPQLSCSSLPITPAADGYPPPTAPTTRSASATPNENQSAAEELLRLKLELAQAQNRISRLDHELAQTRLVTQDSGRGTPGLVSEPDFSMPLSSADFSNGMAPSASPNAPRMGQGPVFNAPSKLPYSREPAWAAQDDTRSDTSDAMSSGALARTRGIWNNNSSKPGFYTPFQAGQMTAGDNNSHSAPWLNNNTSRVCTQPPEPWLAPMGVDAYRPDRIISEQEMTRPAGRRANRYDNRYSGYSGFSGAPVQYQSAPDYTGTMQGTMSNGIGAGLFSPYQQQPVGTPLSPHATEFTSAAPPWKSEVRPAGALTRSRASSLTRFRAKSVTPEGQTYLPATEPLNYRRLLDRNVTCDWKYIVDKIVCNNDQQASIFLQQKLKVGTPEQKYDVVEAIVAQAYPLMVNRFGNFLVQRCFEHGTPEQVIKIAEAIRGNTLNLSMDPFGCHVVQKAFDSVPEDYKAIMVHELLRRIPETVIHRYACHVWQKLFELRWTESPPQIMKYVNEALRGMWHEVALGETGSLVVQNIFENCLEEDKVNISIYCIGFFV